MNRKSKIEDIFEFPLFSAPTATPSLASITYVKTTVSKTENTYLSSINLINPLTKEEQRLVPADSSNYSPYWSIDGEKLLFISKRTKVPQVYLYSRSTGEVKQQTYTKKGVDHILWHPNGKSFFFGTVCQSDVKQLEWPNIEGESNFPTAYATEDLRYKMNGRGLLTTGEEDCWCEQQLDANFAEVICDYNQGYGLKLPADISADGTYLAIERRLERSNPFNFDSGVFLLIFATGKWEQLTPQTGVFGEPSFSTDGRSLAMIGNSLPYLTSNELRIFHYDLDTKILKNVLPNEDIQVTDFGVSDFKLVNTNKQLQWTKDSKKMLFLVTVEGRVALYSVRRGTWLVTRESDQLEHIVDFTCGQMNEVILSIISPKEPASLILLDIEKKERQLLTSSGVNRNFAAYEPVEFQASDGGHVPGFIVFPPTIGQQKVPMIVNIHGGPYAMHTATFHHEVQVMVAAGYGVLLLNPRGSFGYGQAHIDGVINRYGKEDHTDILAGLDQAIATYPQIDESQLFITGGSYGGYLTNWIVAHDQRFKAAVIQRSMVNLVSMVGTSDNGYFFNVSESGADIKSPRKLWEESPLAYVENIETPLLILHSEEDYRCPMEQAEQLYVALKYLGKTARFVRFPHSNHELSRSGLPNLRVKRLTELMDWFTKYRV